MPPRLGDGLMRAPRLPPSIESVVKAQGAGM